jgi:hypothetical protein
VAAASTTTRPPLPPFTRESAIQKVRLAEDGWNTRDPGKVALAYAIDSRWRNRAEFVNGRDEIVAFLSRKWSRELDYRLIKECGHLRGIASPCGLLTSGTTTPITGTGLMAMRTGSSMTTASWRHVLRPSTTFPSQKQIANTAGR